MNKLFFLSVIFAIISCTNEQISDSMSLGSQSQSSTSKQDQIELQGAAEPLNSTINGLHQGGKIVKSGSLEFEVSDLNRSKELVDSLLTHRESYYENEQYNVHHNRISYSLLIRIPNIYNLIHF